MAAVPAAGAAGAILSSPERPDVPMLACEATRDWAGPPRVGTAAARLPDLAVAPLGPRSWRSLAAWAAHPPLCTDRAARIACRAGGSAFAIDHDFLGRALRRQAQARLEATLVRQAGAPDG